MNNKQNMKKNKNKGITLIALIITIIVLLILSVVAIRTVTGEGILAHAKNARDEWSEGVTYEEEMFTNITDYLTEYEGGIGKVKVNKKANINSTINGESPDENNPIIPKGFIPVDTETSNWGDGNNVPNAQSVKNGLVITDNLKNGNEFVWIPVADINDMAQYKTDANSKDANGRINYIGILYNYINGNGDEELASDSIYKEPYILLDPQNGDLAHQSEINGWSDTLYQESFNAMIESVIKYKGFYIGRYEMSEEGEKAQSKSNVSSLRNSNGNNWCVLYNKAKTYAPASNTNLKVTSEMIWGCQYDAMLKWMESNDIEVTNKTPTDTGRVNVAKTDNSIEATTSKNNTYKTGNVPGDRLNNVFDLLGGGSEWSQESWGSSLRVARGGWALGNGYSSNGPSFYSNGSLSTINSFRCDSSVSLCEIAWRFSFPELDDVIFDPIGDVPKKVYLTPLGTLL